jgi:metal-dependent amidase/aminoacylase/carboxypeptidase family protein
VRTLESADLLQAILTEPMSITSYAHDEYTKFMEEQGFVVQKHYLLETAWVATYTHGQGGRVLGVNSEMDALPGIGHACGHNLIGISGVAVACAAKAAMEKLGIDGKVILLGTPGKLPLELLSDAGD